MTENAILTGDGCRIAYRFDGPEDAPTLLLSNALGTSMAMWEPQIADFARHFRVLRYDSRGHGASDAPAGAYSMDRLGRDVIELLDRLGIENVDFCGLSKGGMVGQWLGIREPARIRQLVLANTSAFMGPASAWDDRIALVREKGLMPLSRVSIERWFTPAFQNSGSDEIGAISDMLLSTSSGGYAGCCAAIRDMDMRRMIPLITVPTLVIGGTLDSSTPPSHSEALAHAIHRARLVMLEAAHLSNIERPREFSDTCLTFLTS